MMIDQTKLRITDELAVAHRKLSEEFSKPFHFREAGNIETFRFAKPNLLHFVYLHLGQITSNLNAMMVLIDHGFLSETMSLVRQVYEAETKVRFVSEGLSKDGLAKKQAKFLSNYFSDNARFDGVDRHARTTPQAQIIETNAKAFAEDLKELRAWMIDVPSNLSGSDVRSILNDQYRMYSNFLHGRYPEQMFFLDYESNGEFNLNGSREELSMRPAIEVLALLETNALKLIVSTICHLYSSGCLKKDAPVLNWAVHEAPIDIDAIDILRHAIPKQRS